jgi:uncharacterized protein (TIGR01244 family)
MSMTAPHLNPLADGIFATAQLEPTAMQWAADAGFKSIINNRPDFEGGPTQPTSAAIEAAARAAGLQYAYLPVSPSVHTANDIEAMARLVNALPQPILAFCRSGARTAKLFAAATQG